MYELWSFQIGRYRVKTAFCSIYMQVAESGVGLASVTRDNLKLSMGERTKAYRLAQLPHDHSATQDNSAERQIALTIRLNLVCLAAQV
jgi:hypothetical protein